MFNRNDLMMLSDMVIGLDEMDIIKSRSSNCHISTHIEHSNLSFHVVHRKYPSQTYPFIIITNDSGNYDVKVLLEKWTYHISHATQTLYILKEYAYNEVIRRNKLIEEQIKMIKIIPNPTKKNYEEVPLARLKRTERGIFISVKENIHAILIDHNGSYYWNYFYVNRKNEYGPYTQIEHALQFMLDKGHEVFQLKNKTELYKLLGKYYG